MRLAKSIHITNTNYSPETNYLYNLFDIVHTYNSSFTIRIPRLVIEREKATGVSGPNGSGKSTLLKFLALVETPQKGRVIVNRDVVDKEHKNRFVDKEIILLPQNPYLLKRSVYENIVFGLKVRGLKRGNSMSIGEALRLVGLEPSIYTKRKPHQLSGGEAQRVALAARLVLKPKVLVLDEPTSSIDRQSVTRIKMAIQKVMQERSTSFIISSHDMLWLNATCNRVIKLYQGEVKGSGSDNIIEGPWNPAGEGIWKKPLADGQEVYATCPPDRNSVALLHPSNIILSATRPDNISAQNILRGKIIHMSEEKDTERVLVDVRAGDISLISSVTVHAAKQLGLLPGMELWIVFKASSLEWY